MTPYELIHIIREEFLDDVSDSVDVDDTDLLYKDSMLLRLIGEAQRQACFRQDLRHLFDKETAELCEIQLVAGQMDYALDARILRLHRVLCDGEILHHITEAWMDAARARWRDSTGEPRLFFVTERTLSLDRPPSAGSLALEVWREPLMAPNMHDELEWTLDPEKLGHWVAFRAFMRPDIGQEKMALSKMHRDLFDQAFGAEVSAKARAELLAYTDLNFGPATTPVPRCGTGSFDRF